MKGAQIRVGVLGAVLWLLCATQATAQEVVASLQELRLLGETSSKVTIVDRAGREFSGTIAEASETQLSLRIAGAIQRFAVDDVRAVRVRKEDSLWNGALLGAAIGGGLTSLVFLDNECRDDPACYAAVGVYAGLGALAGLGIDALIRRDVVVYTAPAPSSQGVFRVAPFIGPRRTGLQLRIAF
jgi:hypothetical protein